MNKVTIRVRAALKTALLELAETCPRVLVYGEDSSTCRSFCKPIAITDNIIRLLASTQYEVRGLSYYVSAEKAIVTWLKKHMPGNDVWWHMASASNWLKYNVASDLYILRLKLADISYYIIMRHKYILTLRNHLYNNSSPSASR